MSAIEVRESLVTFRPDAVKNIPTPVRLYLRLEGSFVLSGGLQPNINRVVTPYTEFDKLGRGAAFQDLGTIEFWFTRKPGDYKPDHAIANVRIVDGEVLGVGRVPGGTEFIATEVRLMLVDSRERIAEPRGGRLTKGLLNPPDIMLEGNLTPNSELVQICIDCINLPVENRLGLEIDELPPPRELKWEGAHAPTELAKILERMSGCICPRSNGGIVLDRIGYAHEGDVPDSEGLPEVRLPGSGRRGKIVVYTSAPYPVTNTAVIEGPDPDTWELVARESRGRDADGQPIWRWTRLNSLSVAEGNIIAKMRQWSELPSWLPGVVWTDVFHCIRLSKKAVDPATSPVWRVVRGSSGGFGNIQVEAKIAVRGQNGGYANATDFVTCQPLLMHHDGETQEPVLEVAAWLCQVDAPSMNPISSARALAKGDLRVGLTYEDADQTKKEFLAVAFERRGGKVEMLTTADTLTAVTKGGPDVVVLPDQSLRLYKVNGEPKNRDELNTKAKALAERYFSGDEEDYRIVVLPGFVAVEVSGMVNEVAWNQAELTTTIKVNGWRYPLQQSRAREILQAAAAAAAARENQKDPAGTYVGGTGKAELVVVLGSSPGATAGGGAAVLWATAQAHWTSGNTVWAMPRTSRTDSTPPTGASRVLLYLTLPLDATPHNVEIAAGSALAYDIIGENGGLCRSVKQGSDGSGTVLPTPTTQFTIPMCLNQPQGSPGDPNY